MFEYNRNKLIGNVYDHHIKIYEAAVPDDDPEQLKLPGDATLSDKVKRHEILKQKWKDRAAKEMANGT